MSLGTNHAPPICGVIEFVKQSTTLFEANLSKFLFCDETILVDVKESESDVGRILPFSAFCRRLNLQEVDYNF